MLSRPGRVASSQQSQHQQHQQQHQQAAWPGHHSINFSPVPPTDTLPPPAAAAFYKPPGYAAPGGSLAAPAASAADGPCVTRKCVIITVAVVVVLGGAAAVAAAAFLTHGFKGSGGSSGGGSSSSSSNGGDAAGVGSFLPPGVWMLRFGDDFEGANVNRTKWRPFTGPFQNGTNMTVWDDPANAVVSGGFLHLVTTSKYVVNTTSPGSTYMTYWTTGGLLAPTPMGYGYYEARLRIPPARGNDVAFWMQRSRAFEIDGPEIFWPKSVNPNCAEYNSTHLPSMTAPATLSDDFHVYGFDWRPSGINFYFDGQEYASSTCPFANDTAYLRLSNHVVWWSKADAVALNNTEATWDWVRVYDYMGGY